MASRGTQNALRAAYRIETEIRRSRISSQEPNIIISSRGRSAQIKSYGSDKVDVVGWLVGLQYLEGGPLVMVP